MRWRAPVCRAVVAALALLPPISAGAQPTAGGGRGLPNQCDAVPAGPTPAASHPEGIVVLRLREELGAAHRVVQQLEGGRAPRGVEVRRLLALQREMDSVLAALMRGAGPSGPLPVRSWRPQVAGVLDSAERAVRELEGELERPASGTTGYLGVSLSGAQLRTLRPDGLWVSHCEYPVVEAVDPGSPAARAGVQAGDTLVALGGVDLRQRAVSYAALLIPGERLVVQLRRGGAVRERAVTVAPRPAGGRPPLPPGTPRSP